tara:strand:- start:2520 stop:3911 length:1392 start_codon:yes stop_codon:yes gene_type:complete
MLVLIFFSFLAVGISTISRYQSKNKEYHKERLKRKDRAVVQSIKYMTQPDKLSLSEEFINTKKLLKISRIHNLKLNIYDLGGGFVASSDIMMSPKESIAPNLVKKIQNQIKSNKLSVREIQDNKEFLEIYTVLYYNQQPYGILNIPYNSKELNNINDEIKTEVLVLVKIYSFLFIMSGLIAVFLLKQITRPLNFLTQKLKEVKITKKNEPIFWPVRDEIGVLISQYNNLIDELKEKADQLAKSERQSAWKKMARQIAHEIKNPLTPMRLSVQHFEKTLKLNDPEMAQKTKDFTSTMIQQIDAMSAVASAFSNFASLTNEISEKFSLEKEVEKISDLYKKDGVYFNTNQRNCYVKIDKTHLTRVLNNLIKNAIQSVPPEKNKQIEIKIINRGEYWGIKIKDNGSGINEEIRERVFEPNFTTKNSGMGLGLAMVKNIVHDFNGKISFITDLNIGTTFIVEIPKNK